MQACKGSESGSDTLEIDMKAFTEHQLTAYLTPCYEAGECANPKYARWIPVGKRMMSVIVTANIGQE